MAQVKDLGGDGEERKKPSPPPFHFLALVSFLERPKPNGHASYAGYCYADAGIKLSAKASKLSKLVRYKCHDDTRLGSLFVSWKGVIFQRMLHNFSYYRGICTCVRRFSSRVLYQIVGFSHEIASCQELF